MLRKPARPNGPIQDDSGRITPSWNSYLTALESAIYQAPLSGSTLQRPTDGVVLGEMYYDTTLALPIYVNSVNPVVWHNSVGSVV